MKKRVVCIVQALLFTNVFIFTLAGCGQTKTYTDHTANDQIVNDSSEILTKENDETSNISGNIPDWMAPFAELEQYSKTIYLNENRKNFCIKNNKLLFPESNILLIAKEIAGRNIETVTKSREDVLEVIQLLQKENILEEADTINPNANRLGLKLDIVFLTVESKYVLMSFDIFDDDRLCVSVSAEESDPSFSFWIRSKKLAEKIRAISEYREYDLDTCDNIDSVEIYDNQNRVYDLSNDELAEMKVILTKDHEKADACSGPFDIQFVAHQKDASIYMKWCDDDCRILAIEGTYYKIDQNEADWLQQMIRKIK